MINNLKKLSFQIPTKKKYLYYDRNSLQIQKILKLKNFEVVNTRLEKINILILIKIFINLKNYKLMFKYKFSFIYLLNYIEFINPKIVINFIDNDIRFYELKNFFKNKKFISIQNGWRTKINDIFSKLDNKISKKLSCDYYFIFNNFYGKKLSNYIDAKFIELGSIRNNYNPINNLVQKKKYYIFLNLERVKL